MKVRPLLQAVDFGDDVAEHDEQLSKYFVETSSFIDVIMDRADLILGEKGSGKSAIFSHLADHDAEIPVLEDVHIIPAFNVQGMLIFRRLANAPDLPEEAYRSIWFTFIIGLIANHIVYSYGEVIDLHDLVKLIDDADLKVGPPFVDNLWKRIEKLIRSISKRLEVEGELEVGIPKLPLKARGTGRLRSLQAEEDDTESQVDLEEVLYKCDEKLAQLDKRCWLLFDRLDEAFEHDPTLEIKALRGLLRAHLDLTSYRSRLRTKLFLRSDVMDRITKQRGFVNATHLRRHRLQWDVEGIVDLISRRIASSPTISAFFHIKPEHLQAHNMRLGICYQVVPDQVDNRRLSDWFEENTTDATAALNPRNIISLLQFARRHQLAVYDRDEPEYIDGESLITAQSMERALSELSNTRLEDTVLAEFNSLRPIIERLRNTTGRLGTSEFCAAMDCKYDSDDYHNILSALQRAGVVSHVGRNYIVIARLYRPALQVTRHKSEITTAEKAELRELVDAAIGDVLAGITVADLREMNLAERIFVHKYVKNAYPGFITGSIKVDVPGMKRVIIKRKQAGRRQAMRADLGETD